MQALQHVEVKEHLILMQWKDFAKFKMPTGYRTLAMSISEPGMLPECFMQVLMTELVPDRAQLAVKVAMRCSTAHLLRLPEQPPALFGAQSELCSRGIPAKPSSTLGIEVVAKKQPLVPCMQGTENTAMPYVTHLWIFDDSGPGEESNYILDLTSTKKHLPRLQQLIYEIDLNDWPDDLQGPSTWRFVVSWAADTDFDG